MAVSMALAVLPAVAQQVATHTALSVQTRDLNGHTQANASITVTGADGLPVAGVVSINDGARQLAQVALNSEGQATSVVALTPGEHALRAVYSGDRTHQGSTSEAAAASGQTSSTPSFALSLAAVAPSTLPLTVSPGGAGTIAVTITPEDNSALTAPMFITLSCSGLPSQASCTFTPESIEILPTTPTSCSSGAPVSSCPPISSMLLQTQAQYSPNALNPSDRAHRKNPVAWAVVLPGILTLGGLAWGRRRRAWLSRLALVALLGLVAALGVTACAPLHNFYYNGPPHPIATPAGTFNVTVTGQASNGVTAITNSTTMVLTVQ
jgi:hypothetical protein